MSPQPTRKKQARRPSQYRAPASTREIAARIIDRANQGKCAIIRDDAGKVVGITDGGAR